MEDVPFCSLDVHTREEFLPWLEEPMLNSSHYANAARPHFSTTICRAMY